MARSLQHYQGWLAYDGTRVVVDGLAYTIKVRTFTAIYPYPEERISVYAEPCNKRSQRYLATKAQLGDDWSTDILDSDLEVFVKFMTAAAKEHENGSHGDSH